jgi:predicted O-methyltransferase YrrM
MKLKSLALKRVSAQPRAIRTAAVSSVVDDDRFLTLLNASEFKPVQRRPEILGLASLIRSKGYTSLLEIGTSTAGTSLLLSRALRTPAALTTVDLHQRYAPERLQRSFPASVRTTLLISDSHESATFDGLRSEHPDGFDVVFIDGDHSYAGVRADTLQYGHLARPNGLLVFHDIQEAPDPSESEGSTIDVGGVPTWWKQLRASVGGSFEEFVAEPDQAGFGIGVVHLPPTNDEVQQLITDWSELDVLE